MDGRTWSSGYSIVGFFFGTFVCLHISNKQKALCKRPAYIYQSCDDDNRYTTKKLFWGERGNKTGKIRRINMNSKTQTSTPSQLVGGQHKFGSVKLIIIWLFTLDDDKTKFYFWSQTCVFRCLFSLSFLLTLYIEIVSNQRDVVSGKTSFFFFLLTITTRHSQ